MNHRLPPALLGALLLCCARKGSDLAPAPAVVSTAHVRWFGALHEIFAQQRLEARVYVDDASSSPHTFGIGALSELRGEITILDDIAWIARAGDDGTASVSAHPVRETHEGAALLVLAQVPHWREITVAEDVPSDQLDNYLALQLEGAGVARAEPVPLLISGPLSELQWHVIDGRKVAAGADHAAHLQGAVTGRMAAASSDTTLIGFFSHAHAGVFTHHGSLSHFHVVSTAPAVAGHVDAVSLRKGARLRLPAP